MSQSLTAVAQTLAIDAVTCSVVQALRRVDIEPILLKGPSFAAWLYLDGGVRTYSDTDLLIDPAVAEAANEVLKSLGYKAWPNPPGPRSAATTWLKAGSAGSIDLHTSIWLFDDKSETWERFKKHTQSMRLGKLTVSVLDDVAKTVHVVTHALQHLFQEDGPNADLERAARLVPDDTWRRAAVLSGELGAQDAFALGLWTWPGCQALARRIGVEPPASVSRRLRLLAMGVADSGAMPFQHLGLLPGWRARLDFLKEKVFPSAPFVQFITAAHTRPRGSLAANYARYWWRLLRKTPGALRAWYLSAASRQR